MPIPRLASLTALAVLGAVCAGTAASVYVASIPSREQHAGSGADSWTVGADPSDPALRRMPSARAAGHLVHGACLQIREMLFGASTERWAALDSLTAATGPARQQLRAPLQQFDQASLSGRLAQCRGLTSGAR